MKTQRTYLKAGIFLLLCLFIAIPSLFSIYKQQSPAKPGKGKVKKPAVVDSLQVYINNYMRLLSTSDSLAMRAAAAKEHLSGKLNLATNDSLIAALHDDLAIYKTLSSLKTRQDSIAGAYARTMRSYTARISGSRIITLKGVQYRIFVADLDKHKIRTHYLPGNRQSYSTIPGVLRELEFKRLKALMVTNAGMFTMDYHPEGLYIEEGSKTRFPLDTGANNPNLNFYLKPNGVFYVDGHDHAHVVSTEEMEKILRDKNKVIKCATQSGPMLLIHGKVHTAFKQHSKNLKIRSGVGIITARRIVFSTTVNEESFYNFSVFLRDIFGCSDALFLDGAISKMYLHDLAPNKSQDPFGPMLSVTKK
jgi:uncharacterized protein YigE (DUF2233 family)